MAQVYNKMFLDVRKTKNIVKLQGPPDDKSIGFPPGWRSTPDISSLPWGHLLQHLAPAAK